MVASGDSSNSLVGLAREIFFSFGLRPFFVPTLPINEVRPTLNSHLLHTMPGSIFKPFPTSLLHFLFSVQIFFLSALPYVLFLELNDWNDLMCMYQALVSLHWSLRFFSACRVRRALIIPLNASSPDTKSSPATVLPDN